MLPTGDLAHNPGMCPNWESNWQPFALQDGVQPTEPHQSGEANTSELTLWSHHYWDTKDITRKENYKQISIINTDGKTLNKILIKWIQQHIKRVIHHDQVGFMPRIQVWFKIMKSINVTHHINGIKDKKRNTRLYQWMQRKHLKEIHQPFMT